MARKEQQPRSVYINPHLGSKCLKSSDTIATLRSVLLEFQLNILRRPRVEPISSSVSHALLLLHACFCHSGIDASKTMRENRFFFGVFQSRVNHTEIVKLYYSLVCHQDSFEQNYAMPCHNKVLFHCKSQYVVQNYVKSDIDYNELIKNKFHKYLSWQRFSNVKLDGVSMTSRFTL